MQHGAAGAPGGAAGNALSAGGGAGADGRGAADGGRAGSDDSLEDSAGGGNAEGDSEACWVLKPWSPDGCGSCEQTLEEYCQSDLRSCLLGELVSCEELPGAYTIDEGCGYVRVSTEGHGGVIYIESVYETQTRALVSHYDKGGRSAGCMPELTVGEPPDCADWTTRCAGAGGV